MKQIPVKECIWHTQLHNHSFIKNRILGEIEITPDPKLEVDGNTITKLDWSRSRTTFRPWAKVFEESFSKWEKGELIQNAFPMLNADEREFLMTGMTVADWNRVWA